MSPKALCVACDVQHINTPLCVNEAEHRVYKYHNQGTHPVDDVAVCRQEIDQLNPRKEAKKERQYAAHMRSKYGSKKDNESRCSDLTEYANKLVLAEIQETKNYVVHRTTETQYYVKRLYSEFEMTEEERDTEHGFVSHYL